MTAPALGCRGTGPHQYYGGTICALCGTPAPDTPQTQQDPQAFREGEALAYRRVLALLRYVPQETATKGRDQGRGAAHAVREIYDAVRTLALDAGVDLDAP